MTDEKGLHSSYCKVFQLTRSQPGAEGYSASVACTFVRLFVQRNKQRRHGLRLHGGDLCAAQQLLQTAGTGGQRGEHGQAMCHL